jgi:hypothetical protein
MLDQLYSSVKYSLAAALIVTLFCFGCGTSEGSVQVSREKSKERKAPLSEYEATLNPVDFEKGADVRAEKVSEKTPAPPLPVAPAALVQDTLKDSTKVQEEVVQGFRIQIFSSSNMDEAGAMKLLTQQKFPEDSIYIVFDSPVYKVRVGDYTSRYDAGQRLSRFVDLGYRDAWIVPDRVIQRKRVPAGSSPVH